MEVVRKLEMSDLEQMVELRVGIQDYSLRFMDLQQKKISSDDLKEKTKSYLKKHLNNSLYMFGVFIDDELIANCGFYIDERFPSYDNESGLVGYICNVFTKEKYRGRGFQKKVFDMCINYASKLGITSFKLRSRNEIAIKMYKYFGFISDNNIYSLKLK